MSFESPASSSVCVVGVGGVDPPTVAPPTANPSEDAAAATATVTHPPTTHTHTHSETRIAESNQPTPPIRCLDASHPLAHTWCFYFDDGNFRSSSGASAASAAADFLSHLVRLGSFNSIQNFWSYFNSVDLNIHKICRHGRFNLRLFKDKISPVWDSPSESRGGRWVIKATPSYDLKKTRDIWFELLMAVVGEQLPMTHTISGCVLACKPHRNEVQLWVSKPPYQEFDTTLTNQPNATQEEIAAAEAAAHQLALISQQAHDLKLKSVAHTMRRLLRLDDSVRMSYVPHTYEAEKARATALDSQQRDRQREERRKVKAVKAQGVRSQTWPIRPPEEFLNPINQSIDTRKNTNQQENQENSRREQTGTPIPYDGLINNAYPGPSLVSASPPSLSLSLSDSGSLYVDSSIASASPPSPSPVDPRLLAAMSLSANPLPPDDPHRAPNHFDTPHTHTHGDHADDIHNRTDNATNTTQPTHPPSASARLPAPIESSQSGSGAGGFERFLISRPRDADSADPLAPLKLDPPTHTSPQTGSQLTANVLDTPLAGLLGLAPTNQTTPTAHAHTHTPYNPTGALDPAVQPAPDFSPSSLAPSLLSPSAVDVCGSSLSLAQLELQAMLRGVIHTPTGARAITPNNQPNTQITRNETTHIQTTPTIGMEQATHAIHNGQLSPYRASPSSSSPPNTGNSIAHVHGVLPLPRPFPSSSSSSLLGVGFVPSLMSRADRRAAHQWLDRVQSKQEQAKSWPRAVAPIHEQEEGKQTTPARTAHMHAHMQQPNAQQTYQRHRHRYMQPPHPSASASASAHTHLLPSPTAGIMLHGRPSMNVACASSAADVDPFASAVSSPPSGSARAVAHTTAAHAQAHSHSHAPMHAHSNTELVRARTEARAATTHRPTDSQTRAETKQTHTGIGDPSDAARGLSSNSASAAVPADCLLSSPTAAQVYSAGSLPVLELTSACSALSGSADSVDPPDSSPSLSHPIESSAAAPFSSASASPSPSHPHRPRSRSLFWSHGAPLSGHTSPFTSTLVSPLLAAFKDVNQANIDAAANARRNDTQQHTTPPRQQQQLHTHSEPIATDSTPTQHRPTELHQPLKPFTFPTAAHTSDTHTVDTNDQAQVNACRSIEVTPPGDSIRVSAFDSMSPSAVLPLVVPSPIVGASYDSDAPLFSPASASSVSPLPSSSPLSSDSAATQRDRTEFGLPPVPHTQTNHAQAHTHTHAHAVGSTVAAFKPMSRAERKQALAMLSKVSAKRKQAQSWPRSMLLQVNQQQAYSPSPSHTPNGSALLHQTLLSPVPMTPTPMDGTPHSHRSPAASPFPGSATGGLSIEVRGGGGSGGVGPNSSPSPMLMSNKSPSLFSPNPPPPPPPLTSPSSVAGQFSAPLHRSISSGESPSIGFGMPLTPLALTPSGGATPTMMGRSVTLGMGLRARKSAATSANTNTNNTNYAPTPVANTMQMGQYTTSPDANHAGHATPAAATAHVHAHASASHAYGACGTGSTAVCALTVPAVAAVGTAAAPHMCTDGACHPQSHCAATNQLMPTAAAAAAAPLTVLTHMHAPSTIPMPLAVSTSPHPATVCGHDAGAAPVAPGNSTTTAAGIVFSSVGSVSVGLSPSPSPQPPVTQSHTAMTLAAATSAAHINAHCQSTMQGQGGQNTSEAAMRDAHIMHANANANAIAPVSSLVSPFPLYSPLSSPSPSASSVVGSHRALYLIILLLTLLLVLMTLLLVRTREEAHRLIASQLEEILAARHTHRHAHTNQPNQPFNQRET